MKLTTPAVRTDSAAELKVVRRIELGMSGVWRAAAVVSDNIYVAGVLESRLAFAAVTERGNVQKFRFPWPDTYISADLPIKLLGQRSPLLISLFDRNALPLATVFPPTDETPYQLRAGSVVQRITLGGIAVGPIGQIWAVGYTSDLSLVCYDSTGAVISTRSILNIGQLVGIEDVESDLVYPIPMHIAGDRVLVGLGACC